MTAKPKMLVIDDDQGICDLISHVGDSAGYEMHAMTQPEDIIGVDLESFAVIVLDLNMPGIEGTEIIDHLASIGCSIALIIMSGLRSEVVQQAAGVAKNKGLNVFAVLEKPMSLEKLKGLLSDHKAQLR